MLLDSYTWKARVYPALLAVIPLLASIAAVFDVSLTSFTALYPLAGALGMSYLLSHIIRVAGNSKEPELWQRWGGKPTTIALRWRTEGAEEDRELIRSRLSRLVPDVVLPTREEEEADPEMADRRYEAAVSALREATRDKIRFRTVFSENAYYGFMRNAWAIRPWGMIVTAIAMGIAGSGLIGDLRPGGEVVPMLWVAFAIDLAFLGVWGLFITDRSVRRAADKYTYALFAAAAELVRDMDRPRFIRH